MAKWSKSSKPSLLTSHLHLAPIPGLHSHTVSPVSAMIRVMDTKEILYCIVLSSAISLLTFTSEPLIPTIVDGKVNTGVK